MPLRVEGGVTEAQAERERDRFFSSASYNLADFRALVIRELKSRQARPARAILAEMSPPPGPKFICDSGAGRTSVGWTTSVSPLGKVIAIFACGIDLARHHVGQRFGAMKAGADREQIRLVLRMNQGNGAYTNSRIRR